MKSKAAITLPSLHCRSIFVAVLFALIGCTSVARMYPGPAMPPDQIATLSFYDPIVITSLDGKKVPIIFGVLELLAGPHTIAVDYVSCNYRAGECQHADNNITLTFDAKAGGSYTIGYSREGNAWNAWIIDTKKEGKDASKN